MKNEERRAAIDRFIALCAVPADQLVLDTAGSEAVLFIRAVNAFGLETQVPIGTIYNSPWPDNE